MKASTEQKEKISTNGNLLKTNGKSNGLKSNGLKKQQWNYSKSIEDPKHIKLKSEYDLFIGGKWIKTKKYFDSINPSNEEVIAKAAYASDEDVNKAVNAAEKAYDNVWSKISAKDRGKYIFRIARILQEKAREFAIIESMDGGKAIKESKSVDIPLALAHFFYYAGWADKLDLAFAGRKVSSIGVAGQIIPWNFPLLMAAWKIAPALAC
ncbi:MAG: aldehyde dehydrogenase family protein, partial [bacterium]